MTGFNGLSLKKESRIAAGAGLKSYDLSLKLSNQKKRPRPSP
jgi:hypothetical protein